jgi:hypothetical protein
MPTTDPAERLRSTGRNDDCPCGSTKKYKKCHMREDEETASKQLAVAQAAADKDAAKEAADVEASAGPAARPKAQVSGGATLAPKTPMSHKPVTTPRKAV